MKQEEKELLGKDLCGRLPYEVKCNISRKRETGAKFSTIDSILDCHWLSECKSDFYEIKPYLFPLSSMTEEQKVIYGDLCYAVIHSLAWDMQAALNELIDWLNANHFDYRGLIEKGLAIDCTNLNIY